MQQMPKEGQLADKVTTFMEEYEKDELLTQKTKRKVKENETFYYNLRVKDLHRLKENLINLSEALDNVYDYI